MDRLTRIALFVAIGFAGFGWGGAAHAATVPFTAQLALEILNIAPVVVSGAGVATVNGSNGGVHIDTLQLPASAVLGTALLPITDPGAFPIAGIKLTAGNAAASFSGSGGPMPLFGVAKICLFGPCAAAITNLSVPMSVVGTSASVAVAAAVSLTVSGAPWTTGTAFITPYPGATVFTAMGSRHGPASGTSSTAAPSGQLQFVTPIHISTNIGSSSIIPAFARMTLHFVPEPGTMLLLGGGLSLLATAGRRRMRAR